jgi:hypothetical protein
MMSDEKSPAKKPAKKPVTKAVVKAILADFPNLKLDEIYDHPRFAQVKPISKAGLGMCLNSLKHAREVAYGKGFRWHLTPKGKGVAAPAKKQATPARKGPKKVVSTPRKVTAKPPVVNGEPKEWAGITHVTRQGYPVKIPFRAVREIYEVTRAILDGTKE